jgi:stalled ribosome alternative rescue factor ArfA
MKGTLYEEWGGTAIEGSDSVTLFGKWKRAAKAKKGKGSHQGHDRGHHHGWHKSHGQHKHKGWDKD